ncbi:endonuclease/exonuclease/phosphatase family protein [Rhizodiscina lignyota]|uniref:Endonuclease/exonuclease/phosphatase family protein n=1 Tax=Rhizodiscina lignyota TaxID=1504668 RepID=A0A9P4I8C8_9PEZI|nr:endonuclease/exonuclease/phosphatase family protein [Rhizodiscina lignyota]
MKSFTLIIGAVAASIWTVSSTTIAEINGNRFISPLNGQNVTNVTGLVTAKGPAGIFLRSTKPDKDSTTSESIYVFNGTNRVSPTITVGDIVMVDGTVSEFRSQSTYVFSTEIDKSHNIRVVSSGNKVKPLVIGQDTTKPPTKQFSFYDDGDVFGLPNDVANLSAANPKLQPTKFGMDFWESLTGELVTVKSPAAITKPNSFGDTWVTGTWPVTGRNARGGLTMTDGDANPEAIIIGTPLDGTDNPDSTVVGDKLEDITGVVQAVFGYYYILPLTALKVSKHKNPAEPDPASFKAGKTCSGLTFGQYNVENLTPTVAHLNPVASHIVNFLNSPTLMFLQEIQDDNGATDNGVVDANTTLATLVNAIKAAGGPAYSFVDIDPINDQDGGQPGGNIRIAYLYQSNVIQLHNLNPGNATQANEVLPGPELKYNPGLIDPLNTAAWQSSRKPLAAAWETVDGKNVFFTIDVHLTSKDGSSSIEGDPRPPINQGVQQRQNQAEVTAAFVADILTEDSKASVITAGDFNEFAFVQPLETFVSKSGLFDLDEVVGRDPKERYTYIFDMNCQQLDHMFVSKSLRSGSKYEHIHVNTWTTAAGQASDHDPSVAKLNVCKK